MTDLPYLSNNYFLYTVFRLDTNFNDGGIVSIPFNLEIVLDNSGYSTETFNTNSLRLYQTTIFGGIVPYNSSQDNIPFNVE